MSNISLFIRHSACGARRYKAELTDVRSVIERQKTEILALIKEVEGLRSGESLANLQAKVKELEQQVLLSAIRLRFRTSLWFRKTLIC